jgi:hypothetical protein
MNETITALADIIKGFQSDDDTALDWMTAQSIAEQFAQKLGEDKDAFLSACGIAWDDAFNGQHMQPVIEYGDYFEVETSHGTEIVPADVVGALPHELGHEMNAETMFTDTWRELCAPLRYYLEGEPREVIRKTGWLARMSAPGYMDCTDWTAHESEADARAYLIDNYAD